MHLLDLSLIDAIKKKDFQSFKKIMEDTLMKQQFNSAAFNPINYINPTSGDTYLDIVSRDGLIEFAIFLLHKGAEMNRVNKVHNRGPIHFATERGHVIMLAILLAEPMINPNLEAGHQTALHIAVRRDDLICAGLLLKKGANANIRNNKSLTALRLAAIRRQRNMVKLILKRSQYYLDIDTSENDCDETTRAVMRRTLPDLWLPFKYFKINVYELEYRLINNDEIGFLKRIEFVDIQALHGVVGELLKMTVQYDCHEARIGILEKFKGRRIDVKKAAVTAALLGRLAILSELLCMDPEMTSDLILSVCQQLRNRKFDNMPDLLECLELILEQENINIRCMDKLGNTPLYYASQANCHEVVALLLRNGSYLGDVFKVSYMNKVHC